MSHSKGIDNIPLEEIISKLQYDIVSKSIKTLFKIGCGKIIKSDDATEIRPTEAGDNSHSKLLQCDSGESEISANPPLVAESDTYYHLSSEVKDAFSTSNTVPENENGASKTGNEESAPVIEHARAEKRLVSTCVPVAMFGNHVELNHSSNNQPFLTEFQVK